MDCTVIKTLRESAKMSQKELADSIGLTKRSVEKWEEGLSDPSADSLIALSKTFRVTTDYLLGLDHTDMICLDGLDEEEVCYIKSITQAHINTWNEQKRKRRMGTELKK